ncbi:MAG TPA: hypothetical protein VG099_14435, partial [Gemmataceae bacterium]|nr:hypothetical protein [Gemmataceae bacterium]
MIAWLVLLAWTPTSLLAQQPPVAKAQPRIAGEVRQAVHSFRDVAMSPAGRYLAWLGDSSGDAAKPSRRGIHVTDLHAAQTPRRVTAGDGKANPAEHGLAWSPDGSQLAFLSDAAKKGQLQVYVVPATGGSARKLTNLNGAISDLRWAPDGKHIGFLFIEKAPRVAGPTAAVPPETGVIGEKIFEQRLGMVDADNGQTRTLTPGDLYVYEYAWSPDSSSIAVIAAHGSGDNNWYIAQLYTLAVASGQMESVLKTSMQIAVPCWSPDGREIAFIGGLMSDEGVIGGDIFTIPSSGGTPRNLTPDIKASPCWLTWLPSGRILFTEHIDGGSGVATLDPATNEVATLWSGGEAIAAEGRNRVSLTRDGKVSALVRQSFQQPPEIWTGPIGAWQPLTHDNDQAEPRWGKVESMHWKSDEFTVQGWLLYPF